MPIKSIWGKAMKLLKKLLFFSLLAGYAVYMQSAGSSESKEMAAAEAVGLPVGITELAVVQETGENLENFLNSLVMFVQTAIVPGLPGEAFTAVDIAREYDATTQSDDAKSFFALLFKLLKQTGTSDERIKELYEVARAYALARTRLFDEMGTVGGDEAAIQKIHGDIAKLDEAWSKQIADLKRLYLALFHQAQATGIISTEALVQPLSSAVVSEE